MRTLIFLGLGLCAAGALYRAEEDGESPSPLSPFLAALAIEAGIFLLRRHQGGLLSAKGS
jgi:hypothetical protein